MEANSLNERAKLMKVILEMSILGVVIKMSKNINQDKVDPKLLEILICPVTKSDLQYDSKNNELISKQASLAYPIRDGIPIMLEEEAKKN